MSLISHVLFQNVHEVLDLDKPEMANLHELFYFHRDFPNDASFTALGISPVGIRGYQMTTPMLLLIFLVLSSPLKNIT